MADPVPPIMAVVPVILPRPPAPIALQRTEFNDCGNNVVKMTPAQMARLVNNGVSTAEDVAMLDSDTLMSIPQDGMPAMTKMRLKTLKQWVDAEFDQVIGQPTSTLDIRKFTVEVCRDLYSANCPGKEGWS